MKKLLFLILLLPSVGFAGDLKLSVGGGLIPSSSGLGYGDMYSFSEVYGPTVSVKIGYTWHMVEFGAGFDFGSFNRRGNATYSTYQNMEYYDLYQAGPYSMPYVYGNAKFKPGKKISLYGGMTIGVFLPGYKGDIGHMAQTGISIGMHPELVIQNKPLTLGVQAGMDIALSKRTSFYTEFGLRTYHAETTEKYAYEKMYVNYRLWYFPVTVGLSFKLFSTVAHITSVKE